MPSGIVRASDTADLTAKLLVEEVFAIARLKYNLRDICTVVPMEHLKGAIRIPTGLTGQENVQTAERPEQTKGSWTSVSFDLEAKGKNMVTIEIPVEVELKSSVNLMQLYVRDAAKEIARMEDSQIYTVMETADEHAGTNTDWSSKTNGVSDYNPLDAISSMGSEIMAYGYTPRTLAVGINVYHDLIANTHVRDTMDRGTVGVTGQLPMLGGYRVKMCPSLADSRAWLVADQDNAIVLGDGPVRTVKYAVDPAFIQGYAIAKWVEPKLANTNAIREHDYS